MVSLRWDLTRVEEVTLVELAVASEHDAAVTIRSDVAPVWPPRRRGQPAAGWEGDSFQGRVAAGERLVLGYASPGAPVEPPARVVHTAPPGGSDGPPTARALVRSLGEASPPRDALSVSDRDSRDAVSAGGETHTGVLQRLRAAERLSAARTESERRAAVRAVGGLERVRGLAAELEADRCRLGVVPRHETGTPGQLALRQRLAAVDVPVSTLEQVV